MNFTINTMNILDNKDKFKLCINNIGWQREIIFVTFTTQQA